MDEKKDDNIHENLKYKCFNDFGLKYYNRIFNTTGIKADNINISLKPNEIKTFNDFLECFKDTNVCIRAAGGWVRDKILKCNSDDIDIALDTMKGTEFGDKFLEYYQKKYKNIINISKIEANPDQSKHLETVTFKLNGIDFDVVNLRKEEYTDHSRIPDAKYATPKEDALRRDLTFNALFYNINTKKVEDYTGKGVYIRNVIFIFCIYISD